MLSFFPRGVLDEILNLIESVSEGFPSYSWISDFGIKACETKLHKKVKPNERLCHAKDSLQHLRLRSQ